MPEDNSCTIVDPVDVGKVVGIVAEVVEQRFADIVEKKSMEGYGGRVSPRWQTEDWAPKPGPALTALKVLRFGV